MDFSEDVKAKIATYRKEAEAGEAKYLLGLQGTIERLVRIMLDNQDNIGGLALVAIPRHGEFLVDVEDACDVCDGISVCVSGGQKYERLVQSYMRELLERTKAPRMPTLEDLLGGLK